MSWHSALRYGWRSGAEACRTIRQAARDERALAYARRALAPLPQARVAAARSEWDAQNSRLAVRVTLDLGGEQAGLEVRI